MWLRKEILRIAKATGAFSAVGRLARKGIRVMCYHGFSLGDEHVFRPKLFMTAGTFERRLRWLREGNYEPVSLQTAIARLKADAVTGRELVVTIDDGFFSVRTIGWPLLKAYGFPATLYVTTYYTGHPNPIFRLALQYMVWRTDREVLDLTPLNLPFSPHGSSIPLKPTLSGEKLWKVIDQAEATLSESQRIDVARRIGEQLGVDYEDLRQSRRLSLLTGPEIVELDRSGLDIQLHTHRHRLPPNALGIRRELEDNRQVLEGLTQRRLTHLCYPSGIWDPSYWPVLEDLGIESATTCEPGLNDSATPILGLRRFLDAEDLPELELEAELSGFKGVLRPLLKRRARSASEAAY